MTEFLNKVVTSKIIIFSNSSPGSMLIARAIQANLSDEIECTIWDQGALPPNKTIMDSLHEVIAAYDFAICVFDPVHVYDTLESEVHFPSDNVVYESAASTALLGIDRTFVFVPEEHRNLRLPEYIRVRNWIRYPKLDSGNVRAKLAKGCFIIRERVLEIGPRVEDGYQPFGQKIKFAGAVCFRNKKDDVEYLTVSSTAGRRVIPKGRIKPEETIGDAALRHAHDEGGVIGAPFSVDVFWFRHMKANVPQEQVIAVKLVKFEASVKPRATFRDPAWHNLQEYKSLLSVDRTYEFTKAAHELVEAVNAAVHEGLTPIQQVGVIPIRKGSDGVSFLLVTSKRSRNWLFPKGRINPGEEAIVAAKREAFEEAGVSGEVSRDKIGSYSYERHGILYNVDLYTMSVLEIEDRWPEGMQREREWFSFDEAVERVYEEELKALMLNAKRSNEF